MDYWGGGGGGGGGGGKGYVGPPSQIIGGPGPPGPPPPLPTPMDNSCFMNTYDSIYIIYFHINSVDFQQVVTKVKDLEPPLLTKQYN